jgi:hypothetical protein
VPGDVFARSFFGSFGWKQHLSIELKFNKCRLQWVLRIVSTCFFRSLLNYCIEIIFEPRRADEQRLGLFDKPIHLRGTFLLSEFEGQRQISSCWTGSKAVVWRFRRFVMKM